VNNLVPALLARGLLLGLAAGVLAFGFAKLFGEPLVEQAIAFEEHHPDADESPQQEGGEHPHEAAAGGHHHDADEGPELVSRGVQANAGLLVATIVYGAALGGLFALVFAYWNQRIPHLTTRGTATLLAGLSFVAISLVPALIYPANPPAVGRPDTIETRTALYFGALALSIAGMALAVALGRRLLATRGPWNAAVVALLAYVGVMLITGRTLPAINEVPPDFSAELLWKFRVTSIGMNLVLWSTLGILFGFAAERVLPNR
jgi:predicted cobalt transporter CbtA